MVEQMVSSNLSKYGLGNYPNIISTSDLKQEAVSQPKSPINNVNRNLVYARRKSETENRITSGFQQAEQPFGDKTLGSQKGNESSANIQVNSVNARIRNYEKEQPAMENWSARFAKLQKYLQQCDTSNQEVYHQKLRSFSPDECNRHAVELERRAIQLTVEEGSELKRVKDLNVLGKSAGNNLLLGQLTPVLKSENLV